MLFAAAESPLIASNIHIVDPQLCVFPVKEITIGKKLPAKLHTIVIIKTVIKEIRRTAAEDIPSGQRRDSVIVVVRC